MMLFNWSPKCKEWRAKMAYKFKKKDTKEEI
jgi:hypothetical protein